MRREPTPPGDEIRSVIAGYHWFTDWGRDTMISLEGLTLTTGRQDGGRLHPAHVRPLRPRRADSEPVSRRPERKASIIRPTPRCGFSTPSSGTSQATGDRHTLRLLLADVSRHRRASRRAARGSAFMSIRPTGCCRRAHPRLPLTWMDAKVGDWVVTPRRGKAVEINALWYNALRLLERLVPRDGRSEAARTKWPSVPNRRGARSTLGSGTSDAGYLYDIVDGERGDDPSLRPESAVRHLARSSGARSVALDVGAATVSTKQLLTPVGLRSLSPDDPDYKPRYDGDLRARDAAYHQGTVWPWLIGPFVDAWLRVHPDDFEHGPRLPRCASSLT